MCAGARPSHGLRPAEGNGPTLVVDGKQKGGSGGAAMSRRPTKWTTGTWAVLCCSAWMVGVLAVPTPLAADPVSEADGTIYRLGKESTYQEGCFPPCMCPILAQMPARGTFKLTHVGCEDPSIDVYAVDEVNWTTPYYMRLIDPFRRYFVYPPLFRQFAHSWEMES